MQRQYADRPALGNQRRFNFPWTLLPSLGAILMLELVGTMLTELAALQLGANPAGLPSVKQIVV
jgi:hypothetical protein